MKYRWEIFLSPFRLIPNKYESAGNWATGWHWLWIQVWRYKNG